MIDNNKIKKLSIKIQKDCIACDGDGCIKCARTISRIQKYSDANIPSTYWMQTFSSYSGDEEFKNCVQEILSKIDQTYETGRSYMFVGPLGVGKTFAICSILKMAVCKDYVSKYFNMVEIINNVLSQNNSTFLSDITKFDFLAIDEFDQRWIFPSEKSEQIFSSTMEYILRSRFQNGLPTFLATNNPDVDTILSGMHGKAFASLRSQYMETVFLTGRDFRRISNE